MASSIKSHETLLRKYMQLVKPERIIEWGPGESTEIMLDEDPDVKIISIEHDTAWYNKAVERFKDYPNVGLKLYDRAMEKKKCKYPYWAFKWAPYDLAFIDGRRRVECAIVAMQCLSDKGVAILHDAGRRVYRKPLDPFIQVLEEEDSTLAFRPGGYISIGDSE